MFQELTLELRKLLVRCYGHLLRKSFTSSMKNGRRQVLRPEQKIVAFLNVFVHKFSKPDDLVLDDFWGTLPLDEHRRFGGCQKDSCSVEI